MSYDSLIVFSNLIYLCPIFTILYEKFFSNLNKKLKSYYSNPDCLILICGFILITFISSIYHKCVVKYHNDKIQKNFYDENCYDGIIKLNLLYKLDHLISFFTIGIIFIIITPIYKTYNIFIMYLLFVFMVILVCIEETQFKKLYNLTPRNICYIILGCLALVYYSNFIYNIKYYSYTSIIILSIATIFFITGIILLQKQINLLVDYHYSKKREYYKKSQLYHSLWHLFGGIAGSLLLLIRIKNIDILEKYIIKQTNI